MPLQNWSDRIVLLNLQDDPQFTDDMNALIDQVEQRGGMDVLLDFSEVNFLNSTNITRLLKVRKMLTSTHPGRLKLCSIPTSVWGVLLVTGLDKIFDFADDIATGLAGLQMDPGQQPRRGKRGDA